MKKILKSNIINVFQLINHLCINLRETILLTNNYFYRKQIRFKLKKEDYISKL